MSGKEGVRIGLDRSVYLGLEDKPKEIDDEILRLAKGPTGQIEALTKNITKDEAEINQFLVTPKEKIKLLRLKERLAGVYGLKVIEKPKVKRM
jgi:hypothetical protein